MGGPEGLPEDGEKGDNQRDKNSDHKDPPVALQPVNEIFKIFLDGIDSDRYADEASSSDEDHIFPDTAPRFRVHSAAEDLPHRYVP